MNNRVNYTVVGFFVLAGLVLTLGLSYWMLKPSSDSETAFYNIYFDESVLGLNLDAPVKYRGINVGKVTHIGISPTNSEQVRVLIAILKTTPIKVSTVARLTAQGITGLSYINLSLGANDAPNLVAKKGEAYPTIATVPSFFENIEQSLDGLSVELSRSLTGVSKLLNEENQIELSLILKNTASLSAKMNKLLDEETIEHLQRTSANLDSFSQKLDALTPNIDAFIEKSAHWENDISESMSSIKNTYLGMGETMDEVRRAISSGEFNLKKISSDVVPTLNETFSGMQELMINLNFALERYKRSPSDILYKKEDIKKAPGEE